MDISTQVLTNYGFIGIAVIVLYKLLLSFIAEQRSRLESLSRELSELRREHTQVLVSMNEKLVDTLLTTQDVLKCCHESLDDATEYLKSLDCTD